MSLTDLVAVSDEFDAWLRDTRQVIHMNPELLFEEEETSELARKHLTELGVPFRARVGGDGRLLLNSAEINAMAGFDPGPSTGGTGVLATIRGTRNEGTGRCILLRADMDALPLQERNDVPYKSRNPGKMHACGHDVHTTVLLGVAEILSNVTDTFDGTVKLMFQPGEEGGAGALAMIEDGILEDPPVDAALALHVAFTIPVGQIAVTSGPTTAAADMFQIKVFGKGGHAAMPNESVDPIIVSAQIITALQTLVSREVDPIEAAVVSVTSVEAGVPSTIIPDDATIFGTVRTFNPDVREQILTRIPELAAAIATGFRANAESTILRGYPALNSDPQLAQLVSDVGAELLGETSVNSSSPAMGAEDFAFLSEHVPTCMFGLGVRNEERGIIYPVHHPQFDVDEDAIATGVKVMAGAALRFLGASEE